MSARNHLNEKKIPMTATTVTRTDTSATSTSMSATSAPRSTAVNLINEALSRVRTRPPQNTNSEAHRSARRIAIQARRQQARELGNLAQFGVR
jgi:hypothetical protein